MPKALEVNKPEDLGKLKGWVVQFAKFVGQPQPMWIVEYSHVLAPNPIRVIVTATVIAAMNGNITLHNPNININVADVEVPDTEGKKE